MELNFPHQNSLNEEQKQFYIEKISDAFDRMGFSFYTNSPEMYELLLFHIGNPTKEVFDNFTSINYNNITLKIQRIDYNEW